MINPINRLISFFYRKKFRICHKTVYIERLGRLVGGHYITIGRNSSIQKYTYLTAWDNCGGTSFTPEIIIGEDCHIGAFNHITCVNRI